QPGTGTFTSRDTATLTPNPSVQANRYTYANASPLTGIDPTGHYTDHLSRTGGPEYDLSRDPQEVAESYARNGIIISGGGGSSGLCIGRACSRDDIGGGAMGCDAAGCFGVIITSWLRIYTDDEAKRRGLMPNGEPVDQPNFWDASEKVRETYLAVWNPELSSKEKASLWVSVGGLRSFNPSRVKVSASGKAYYLSKKAGKVSGYFPHLNDYMLLLKYNKYITEAAKRHGIHPNALAALLIYEGIHLEPNEGPIVSVGVWLFGDNEKQGWGLSQLEVYKVRKLLDKYYKREYDQRKMSNRDIANLITKNPRMAISLAAARMRDVKETYRITDSTTGRLRPLNDWEATLAYCGCVGNAAQFRKWAESGYQASKAHSGPAQRRYEAFFGKGAFQGWVDDSASEYWRCVAQKCYPFTTAQ
ncbi:hypothetical protein, partial [Nonomuraea indica]|uniref:hypothetical protein n=1 Tax=Nonomuraea indica TaxID=1581193 RepID=UPI0015DDB1EC